MSDREGYRDELGAAQARIAELEQEVARLREPAAGGADPALAALEEKRRLAVKQADPKAIRRGAIMMGLIFVVLFGGLGLAMLKQSLTLGFGFVACGVVFGSLIAWLTTTATRVQTRHVLEAAEQKLAEARRLRAVERALAEARPKVRVGESGEPLSRSEEEERDKANG